MLKQRVKFIGQSAVAIQCCCMLSVRTLLKGSLVTRPAGFLFKGIFLTCIFLVNLQSFYKVVIKVMFYNFKFTRK